MPKYNIQRYSQTVTIAADGTTANADTTRTLYGKLVAIKSVVPALVGTTTLTITIKDENGVTIYTKASIAEGAGFGAYIDANNHPLQLPIDGILNITVTASNAQTSVAAPIPVVLLIDRGN